MMTSSLCQWHTDVRSKCLTQVNPRDAKISEVGFVSFIHSSVRSRRSTSAGLLLTCALIACGGTLDAGSDQPRGVLPVDERNPVVVCNDGYSDNWQGEYAMLFASTGELVLAGIVINDGWPWTNLNDNITGWRQMVTAARDSGLRNIPDPIASTGPALVRPDDGNIDSTAPNRSEGAHFILDAAQRLSLPFRPLVVVTGGRLTDVADAYLMDRTLPDRVIVVSSLGAATADGADMGIPNGELDTWASIIVAQKFRYVQVSMYNDPTADATASLISELPANSFTSWIQSKQPNIQNAYDQAPVQVVAIPSIVLTQTRVMQKGVSSDNIPILIGDPNGPDWLVTQTNNALATARFSEMLLDPATFK